MDVVFYFSAAVAIIAVACAIAAQKAVHALLYLLAGLMSLALNLYLVGNQLGALLLVIVYGGAIMVLFIFVVMLLNPSSAKALQMNPLAYVRNFFGPLLFASAILLQFIFVLIAKPSVEFTYNVFSAREVANALFTDAWYFVELLSLLLTGALVGAFHIGRRRQS